MSNVRLQKLSITLGGNEIIRELDLAVEDGEFLVLLGPSGCGKSTLLHSIAGLIDVSSGTVEIGGEDMTWADPSERHIGMVFQSYALYPTMTVEKNMSFGLRINGTPKDEIARRIKKTAEMLHLEPLLQRKPAALSGGQRQRVAIGRALVREAGVFLFDEPLSNLDAKLRAALRRELKLLHQQLHATMIYVTHDQVEAMTLATRIVVMQGGKIQQIGTPACVYEQPVNLFVAGFLGAPAMNFIAGSLDEHGVFVTDAITLDLSAYQYKAASRAISHAASKATLGVRPEQVQITAGGSFSGSVALVEPMGNHQVVWVKIGTHLFSAIVNDTRAFAVDETVNFAIDTARVSLFDPVTEQRL
jgi:multiple sugar transport system ATP-binding protein